MNNLNSVLQYILGKLLNELIWISLAVNYMEFICKHTGIGHLDSLFFHCHFEIYKLLFLTSK